MTMFDLYVFLLGMPLVVFFFITIMEAIKWAIGGWFIGRNK